MKDYYAILGISQNANDDEIKNAYRAAAKKFHPDVNKNDATTSASLADANEAYSVLGNRLERFRYNSNMAEAKRDANKNANNQNASQKEYYEKKAVKENAINLAYKQGYQQGYCAAIKAQTQGTSIGKQILQMEEFIKEANENRSEMKMKLANAQAKINDEKNTVAELNKQNTSLIAAIKLLQEEFERYDKSVIASTENLDEATIETTKSKIIKSSVYKKRLEGTYYETLGLESSKDLPKLFTFYYKQQKKLQKKLDNGDLKAEAMLEDLKEAYKILSDHERRNAYNAAHKITFF